METPWEPATTGTFPSAEGVADAVARTSRILALLWVVSVMKPAWLPVKLTGLDAEVGQRHAQQRHGLALAGGDQHVHLAARAGGGHGVGQGDEVVGLLAHGADDHDDTSWPAAG